MKKQYQKLFAGCVRQKGNEVRKTVEWAARVINYPGNETDHLWHPVTLIGHTLLQSDFMVAEYRRPV